jgi:2-oxoglutarate/2-oxoacid ferredoxin oxidoreductase subunit beta
MSSVCSLPSAPTTGCKPSDYASAQEVRWCPGCGDYSILAQVKKVLSKLGIERSKTVFVSGIGCSSRFPYYMGTYGFHSIHGRAATLATGLRMTRPDLSVWMITGDGDALSIGGNHLLHILRRNVNVKILLFNNRIYGLTKGQYSPTTVAGQKTKSSPLGVLDRPIRPISIAIGAEASFAARALDVDTAHLEYVLERAAKHVGTAFVEIYQNCAIFNNGAYAPLADKQTRPETLLYMEHGKPMVFGAQRDKGIRLRGLTPEIVAAKDVPAESLLHHDEQADPSLAFLLSRMSHPEFPEPVGVFRAVEQECLDLATHRQLDDAVAQRGRGDLQTLLNGNAPWTVE